jgi:anti-sigma factor RsiW
MDDCRRTGERLAPYADELLPPTERRDVERHLGDCPPCHRSAEKEKGGRSIVRECAEKLRQQDLPPGLRSRCEALAREHSAASPLTWRARLVPATLMATLAMVAGVGLLSVATHRSDALLAAQLTADHVKCFKVFGTEVEASAREVEATLDDYGWDMHVPGSSADADARLVGGRRCLYADGTMPHVMYRAAGAAPVSLFRLEGERRDEGEVTTLGHRCRIWSRGGHTYVLVAPEAASNQTARLLSYVRQEAR